MALKIRIAKLDELLRPHLEANEDIIDYETKPLTDLGDNFGSQMISLNVHITNRATGHKRTLQLVNKMIPQNQAMFDLLNIKVTYIKEMDFYLKAIPAMHKLQQDNNVPQEDLIINLFPKCFGCRIGFGRQVDKDAAMLLENMNFRGYKLANKKIGLDLNHARLVMEKLAYFHALPIALRKLRPSDYEAGILPAAKFYVVDGESKDKEKTIEKYRYVCAQVFKKLPISQEYIDAATKTTNAMNLGFMMEAKEPFVTISHEDMWVNNVLFLDDPENKPEALAFIDFQTTQLLSPLLDVVFFLFSSVTPSVRRKHFDELFDVYYDNFCKCLRQVNCDDSEFSKEAFLAEMDRVAGAKLFEVFRRSRIIIPNKTEMVGADWGFNVDLGGEEYLKRMEDCVVEFAERKWLLK